MKIPWEYMRLNQLMASVRSDMQLYDSNNLIDNDRVIKIVMECNERLGERIFQSKECEIIIDNYKGDIPTDFYKIENVFAINTHSITTQTGLLAGSQYEYLTNNPSICYDTLDCTDNVVGCLDNSCPPDPCATDCKIDFNNNFYVTTQKKQDILYKYKTICPLILGDTIINKCEDYCPALKWKGDYQIDIENGEFSTSFKAGKIYVAYLGNLTDSNGEVLIPKHPLINSYYEYAIKEKLFEDMFLNSDADVLQKMQYTATKKTEAYGRAFNYVNSAMNGQYKRLKKKWQQDYYNEWYTLFL